MVLGCLETSPQFTGSLMGIRVLHEASSWFLQYPRVMSERLYRCSMLDS